MTEREPDSRETLKLVGEIYKSILRPENFIDVLELWDRNISSREAVSGELLDLLEDQLTAAIPLLEASLKSVVNEDELLSRLSELDRPSFLLSTNGIIIGTNPSGKARFNLHEGDRLDRNLIRPDDMRDFETLLKQAGKADGSDLFTVIGFSTAGFDGQRLEHLAACRGISVRDGKTGYVLVSSMDLVLSDEGGQAFKKSFSATDAEMRIVRHLIAGKRQRDIAEADGIRDDTVKKHIKSLREKTDTQNTTALICLAASFAQISVEHGKLASTAPQEKHAITNSSGQTYVVPGHHKVIGVNGYNVEYVDEGPKNGEPLIIMHSSMIGFVLPPEFIRELAKAGYRVITPFRPGNGVSDPLPGDFCVEKTSHHLLAFADRLGLRHLTVVGGTTGFVVGANMAAAAPSKVRQLIGIAGYLPVEKKRLHNSMARYQRAVLYARMKNRRLAKFLVLSGYKVYLQLGAHKFMSQIMHQSKSDLRVIDDANALGVISVGLRIGGAQGVDALLDDSSLVLKDWSAVFDRITCPIHLFHGDDDSVFKLQIVREFCANHPGIGLTALGNTGQLMIYDNPIEMARKIIAVLAPDTTGKPPAESSAL